MPLPASLCMLSTVLHSHTHYPDKAAIISVLYKYGFHPSHMSQMILHCFPPTAPQASKQNPGNLQELKSARTFVVFKEGQLSLSQC